MNLHEDKATEQSLVFNIVAVNGLALFERAATETDEELMRELLERAEADGKDEE